ncbi:hypothetical protein CAPTEDRAFT_224008 [Capitella teleta]|uniref:Uncharacterized protein n=1 Tax=Capitella teleta TaxID=283909 RepID=R7TNX1_CAPTE|nr:hypothetical protein CAPTEDRAFT_224008 [Capitella teleta]|eukprot:ELT95314.1 hypothetical protein CAPTEDRAFT_224008 [Capitella teleta]
MYVRDLKTDFYDRIQQQRLLILVSLDVDSLCACKILQSLFQCDQVLHTIIPVTGKQSLERAYLENSEGVKFVLLLNCGATFDIIETLRPDDGVVFFICDNHLPVHLNSIFNQVQVQILGKEDDTENLPEFTDLFRDSDDEEDEEEVRRPVFNRTHHITLQDDSGDDSDSSQPKRKKFDEKSLMKKRDKRLWEQKRRELVFQYEEFSKYGTSVAFVMYELAWKMSKDTNDLLWLAIVGITEQYVNGKVERDRYMEGLQFLQGHVSRLNHWSEDEENTLSVDCLRISFETELRLCLFRHWSLFESLCHSQYTACKFKVWTLKGKKRLHEFLAEMGLPLVQCKQKYSSMEVHLRDSIKEMMTKFIEKYGIHEHDLFLPSFLASYGYKNRFCASDVVRVCATLLESMEKDVTPSDSFFRALDVLNRKCTSVMEVGLEQAKLQQKAIVTQVQSFLDMNQIISAGPFLYALVQEGTPDGKYFSNPLCLVRLARFTLEAYCAMSKNKRVRNLPLVIGASLDSDLGVMLVAGIPPISDSKCINCFGKAFEQAASSTNSRVNQDSFDSHVMELKTEDRSKFFDALISLLH